MSNGREPLVGRGSGPAAWAVLLLLWTVWGGLAIADAQTLPAGFQESVAFSGLTEPTAVAFSPDGRVFVAEKSGLVKVFASLSATTPTVFADLQTMVHNFWDRGLLGLALDPAFPANPYVYVLYTYNAAIGGTAPRWPSQGCPNPPGATGDGCVVSGRLSRLEAVGSVMTGPEQVLINDWCQQYPSHSIGGLAFGGDGALYVSGGEGASFTFTDYGQDGNPLNPCGDPPVGSGGVQQPPTAEGGALRSQSLERVAGPVTLSGAILRVDPDSGAGMPDNPLAGSADPNARRIIAYGLRNPFRLTTRPGTDEIWVGDVGWTDWEEINRFSRSTTQVRNFGWPCYEGNNPQPAYSAIGLNICNTLYNTAGAVIAPQFTYSHALPVAPQDPCPPGSSSITGLAFYPGGSYPPEYDGALFFADYSRNCIWVMFNPTASGSPPPALALGLNEGTGTTTADTSGNGNPGTLVGASWSAAGEYGASLDLNGTSGYVRVDNAPLPTADYTYEAWIKPSRVNVYQAIVEGGAGVIELALNDTGRLIIWSNSILALTSASAVPVNTWTHVALTRAGSLLTLYVNGVADPQTGSDLSVLNHGGCPLLIGVDNGDGCTAELNGFFQGQIDEVRVYPRALSASEIQTDMAMAIPNTPPPPSTGQMTIATFVGNASGPVDLKIGPGGDLYYADLNGAIRRIQFTGGTANQPPTALATATPVSGPAPLAVQFDGTGSSDPDPGDTIVSYEWDLAGTGQFTDSTSPRPQHTYTTTGTFTTRLRVTDNNGASTISAPVVITVGSPPTAVIDTPTEGLTWKVSDVISFSGHGTDGNGAPLPASSLSWSVILHHCPSNCHTHPVQTFAGVAGGSFPAPDHEYPSHIELVLTATNSIGLQDTKSVLLFPQTVTLTFESNPSGLQLVVGSSSQATPFDRTVIIGSANSVSAPTPQVIGGTTFTWASWSDGGAQSHNIVAGAAPATLTATYSGAVTVTAFPTSTVIETGTLNGGSAANLKVDDDVYYAVNSTTSGTRTSSWYGVFPGVSKALTSLKISYKGNNSRTCTQTVSVWLWTSSAWVQLNSTSVGTTEVLLANLTPTGTLSDYVSGTSGSGDVRVRVRCVRGSQNFASRGDLMQIVYDAPSAPPPPPAELSVTPTSLTFSKTAGQPNPPAQTVTVTAAAGQAWTTHDTNDFAHLEGLPFNGVDGVNGTGTASFQVVPNSPEMEALPVGTTTGSIRVSTAGSADVVIPVQVIVTAP